MSLRSSDSSYQRYKQYRVNRHRFKTEQVTFPIAMLILIGIITKFWYLIILLTSIFIVLYIVKYFNIGKKTQKIFRRKKEKTWGVLMARKAEN